MKTLWLLFKIRSVSKLLKVYQNNEGEIVLMNLYIDFGKHVWGKDER